MHRDLLRTHRPCARSVDSRSVCDPCQGLQQSGTTAVEVDPRKRDEPEATRRLKHLDTYFGARRLVSIGPDDCTAYAAKRRGVGAANGTINRELNVLGRLLSLAVENKKLLVKPIIRKLDEAPPRAGFFEQDQYQAVRRHLPRTSRWPSRSCTPSGGGRWKCSIWSAATWILAAGTLPLDPGSTVYLTPEIKALLAAPGGARQGAGEEARPDHPGAVPASPRGQDPVGRRPACRGHRRAHPRLPPDLGDGLQARRLPGDAPT